MIRDHVNDADFSQFWGTEEKRMKKRNKTSMTKKQEKQLEVDSTITIKNAGGKEIVLTKQQAEALYDKLGKELGREHPIRWEAYKDIFNKGVKESKRHNWNSDNPLYHVYTLTT
jgi:hypothetical protein